MKTEVNHAPANFQINSRSSQLDFSSAHNTAPRSRETRKISVLSITISMSLAIVATVGRNGVTVVDSQTVLVKTVCGGLITLNFASPDEMMVAAEGMSFMAADAAPLVFRVPETPTNNNNDEVIDITSPPTPPTDKNNNGNTLDDSGASRDMLASSVEGEDEDNEDGTEEEDQFSEGEGLADGVHRININRKDDSFEDTYGLSQELW
jgi:hypothetical protein